MYTPLAGVHFVVHILRLTTFGSICAATNQRGTLVLPTRSPELETLVVDAVVTEAFYKSYHAERL